MPIPGQRKKYPKAADIQKRMKAAAAKLWDRPEPLVEGFDPLVELLMGACASELKKIYDEIESSQARVLDRISSLLTPDVIKGPIPAHAIAYAKPVEPFHIVATDTEFYCTKKENKENVDVFFTPAKPFPVFNAEISHSVYRHKLVARGGDMQEEIFESATTKPLDPSALYLGIKMDEGIETLQGLRLYFDWKSETEEDKQQYLRLLPTTTWFIGDHLIQKESGFGLGEDQNRINLSGEFDVIQKLEDHVLNRYQNHFITFHDAYLSPKALGQMPVEFVQAFSEEELGMIPPDLIWLKVIFPDILPPEAIENAYIQLNCFPVMNRRIKGDNYRLQKLVNIIPLETDDYFLSVRHVKKYKGNLYVPSSSIYLNKGKKRTYTLRQGGTARYDARDASAMMDYVFDLLKDESAAFSAMGSADVLASEIKELNQTIKRLERKINLEKANKEKLTYLVLTPGKTPENVEIVFWDTKGSWANSLSADTALTLYKGADFPRDKVKLVSKTSGGRDPLSSKESLHAYREALLTRGRVVSPADVKAVAYSLLGDRLESVNVSKGVKIGDSPKKGFVRTIEVGLKAKEKDGLNPADCLELGTILQNRSTGILPFNVYLA